MSQSERDAESGRHDGSAGGGTHSSSRGPATDAGGAEEAPTGPLPALPRPGDVVAERYDVVQKLGAGGMGHVYLATHTALQKEVALKVLAPRVAVDEEQRVRFLREARAVSRLRHRCIVEITDFGSTDSGLPFFAMEYLQGEDLAAYLDAHQQLPWRRARSLLLDVLDGLSVAHGHGVVHRDLKPENCFLSRHQGSADVSVKLLDFGIAKLLTEPDASRLTGEGHILGTPHYMSPEQAVGRDIDARADVYACGVLLFEMLTGSLPFSDGSTMAILSQQITQPPPTLGSLVPELEHLDRLEAIVARALQKKADDRYQTAEAFAEALRALDRDPVGVVAVSPWRRPAVLVGAAGMVALGAVLLLSRGCDATTVSDAPATAATDADRDAAASVAGDDAPGDDRPALLPDAGVEAVSQEASGTSVSGTSASGTGVSGTSAGSNDVGLSDGPSATKDRAPARPSNKKRTPAEPPDAVPITLKRTLIIARLERAVTQCGRFASPGGQTLQVQVHVAASGSVSGASLPPPYDGNHPMGQCVAKALNAVELPEAQSPQVFSGPLRLRRH